MSKAPLSNLSSGCRLGLRPAQAAKAIGISPRTLWSETKRGRIPHRRIGRAVVYSIEELRAWLAGKDTKR